MFLSFLIFILIFFLYIHISDQYKKSEDLEIYEMDYKSNIELQKVCAIKQPVLFDLGSVCPSFFENLKNDNIKELLDTSEVKVKDINDYYVLNNTSIDYITLSYDSFDQLSKTDSEGHYFTEGNTDVIEESSELSSIYSKIDPFLKPYFVVQTKYDILSGSDGTVTPMRYHTNERQYLMVTSGSIHVQMTPWKSRKYLHENKDFENYEFWSPVCIANPNPIYKEDSEKIKMVECIIPVGSVLYIPPYWWYSIKFSKDTIICSSTYNSAMNILSNIPSIVRYYLQFHNTHKKVLQPVLEDDEKKSL